MQVLWVSHVIPYPPRAGVLIRCFHLLRSLASRHDVDLVAFIQEPYLRTFYPSIEEGLEDCLQELRKFCRSVTLLPIERVVRPYGKARTALEGLLSARCYSIRWLGSDKARHRIEELHGAVRYDLAHFDTIGLAQYRELVPGVPSTLGHHNIESHMLLRRAELERNPLRKLYFWQEGLRLRRYERSMADAFALHVTCSELDSERLLKIAPQARTACVPNGVDVDFFKARGSPIRPDSLIFVGTMNWYPNVDAVHFLLRDIWPALVQVRPSAKLDIVGAGAPRFLVDLAERSPGVRMHGYVPDFRPMLDSAAIYLCPIRDGGGTKLKILDALAMAKCVVAHPVACEGINVRDGECVRFASTAEDFCRVIVELLGQPRLRERMGSEARRVAEDQYAFNAIGRTMVDLLERLARGP